MEIQISILDCLAAVQHVRFADVYFLSIESDFSSKYRYAVVIKTIEDEYENTRGRQVNIIDLARAIAAAAGEISHAKHPSDIFESDVAHRLPRLVIDLLAKNNGVVIKVGDSSHPKAVEVVTCYPDWAERNERMFEEIRELLRNSLYEKDYLRKQDYVT